MEQYGLQESKYLGKKLREIEDFWINNGLKKFLIPKLKKSYIAKYISLQ